MQYRYILISVVIILGLSVQSVLAQSEPRNQEPQLDITDEVGGSEAERFLARPASDGKQYSWQDGGNTFVFWEAENLVMERYAADAQSEQSSTIAPEDVFAENGDLRVMKKQDWHRLGEGVFPVLVTGNGAWRALPGGVIVVLVPEMKEAEIDAFFAGINLAQVSKMDFTKNAYFIETEPGVVGLELSNKLAGMEEVELSSPNWWSPVQLR